jgi:hypothetical protein
MRLDYCSIAAQQAYIQAQPLTYTYLTIAEEQTALLVDSLALGHIEIGLRDSQTRSKN